MKEARPSELAERSLGKSLITVIAVLGVLGAFLLLPLLPVLIRTFTFTPAPSANSEWPRIGGFSHATLPGATHFRAQYANYDSPSFIFSYQCTPETTRESAFEHVKQVFKWHRVHIETEWMLEMRYHRGGEPGQRASVTWLFEPTRHVMTVLVINQGDCLRFHDRFMKRAHELQRDYLSDETK